MTTSQKGEVAFSQHDNEKIIITVRGEQVLIAKILRDSMGLQQNVFFSKRFIVKQLANETKTYQVEIVETNSRVVSIEAESPEEAREKIRKGNMDGSIVLNDENSYVDVNFNLV